MARLPTADGPGPRSTRRRPRRAGRHLLSLAIAALLLAAASPVHAESGLPVPRFVSLRAGEVNLRTGPGTNYPVDWVYVRRHMPVEVIAEFGTWRKIRDWQGTVGWVHQSLLDGDRTGIVVGAERAVLSKPQADARAVARLEPGVIVWLQACEPDWCRVQVQTFEGWLPRDAFWGARSGETFD